MRIYYSLCERFVSRGEIDHSLLKEPVIDPLNLILLVVVAIIFYRLKNVLGLRNDTDPDQPSDRYGFHRDALREASQEPPDTKRAAPETPHLRVVENQPDDAPAENLDEIATDISGAPEDEGLNGRGLARLCALDPAFDEKAFIAGAQSAYQMILTAFAEADRATLEDLLSPPVYEGFAGAIAAREAAGETLTTEISRMARPVIDDVVITDGLVQITVRFVADIRTSINGAETDVAKTEDLWTFDRQLDSPSPNWLLSATQTVS